MVRTRRTALGLARSRPAYRKRYGNHPNYQQPPIRITYYANGYIRPREAAVYLGYSPGTLEQMRYAQDGPKWIAHPITGRIWYRLEWLNNWLVAEGFMSPGYWNTKSYLDKFEWRIVPLISDEPWRSLEAVRWGQSPPKPDKTPPAASPPVRAEDELPPDVAAAYERALTEDLEE